MTSLRHSVRGSSAPRSAYCGTPAWENSPSSSIGGGGTSKERRQSMNCSSPYSSSVSFLFLPWSAP